MTDFLLLGEAAIGPEAWKIMSSDTRSSGVSEWLIPGVFMAGAYRFLPSRGFSSDSHICGWWTMPTAGLLATRSHSSSLLPPSDREEWRIEQGDLFENEPYRILHDIPVVLTRSSDTEFTAEIEEANLAASGNSKFEAYNYLLAELLDAYDYLSTHQDELGPGPLKQWTFLRKHLVKVN